MAHEKRIQQVNDYLTQMGLPEKLASYYEGRTILVTGGAGAIGSNLVIALSKLVGETGRVVVLDDLSGIRYQEPWNLASLANMMFVRGDVRSDLDLKRVFGENLSIVFHLSTFFANQRSVDYPETAVDVDILGIVKMLQYSRLARVERFVYASSEYASGGPPPNSYQPEWPSEEGILSTHYTSPYQINKIAGEMYCNYFHEMYGLKTVICRCFNSYGPGELPGQYRNVIPNFFYWSMRGLPLPITGNGHEARDFTYVLDLVQGYVKAGFCDNAIGEHFNLAASREIEIGTLATAINELTGNNAGIVFKSRRPWDAKPRSLGSIQKARKLIGFEPSTDFKDGLAHTAEWFRENWEAIERFADFPPGVSSAVRDAGDVSGR